MVDVTFKNNMIIRSYEAKKGDLFVDMRGNLGVCRGFDEGERMEYAVIGGSRSGNVIVMNGDEPIIPVKHIEVTVEV